MTHDQLENQAQASFPRASYTADTFLPRLRAYLSMLPDVRLAYYQTPPEGKLSLTGPDRARVLIAFARSLTGEHADKRLAKIRKHFATLVHDEVEFVNADRVDCREACEAAFNAESIYGSIEVIERDRLYRYNLFLEWNASNKMHGVKQLQPPAVLPPLERTDATLTVEQFLTPIYRHLKMIAGHVRDLLQVTEADMHTFAADEEKKSLTESYMLKGIQSAILITMSVMHRKVRLNARDYRDLFLLMPLYGICSRERAQRLARCADIRDRVMFQYDEVTPVEVYQNAVEVLETLQDFKTFMLEWVFDNYYATSGEFIQGE